MQFYALPLDPPTGAALDGKKTLPPKNLSPKMAAAFHGLITNAGLMAAAILRKSRRHRCIFTYDVTEMADRVA